MLLSVFLICGSVPCACGAAGGSVDCSSGGKRDFAVIFSSITKVENRKLTHTAATVVPFQYRPYMKGAKNAPARAPQEIPISCAIKVGGSIAMITLIAINTTKKILIQRSCFLSSIFLTTLSLIKSNVKVELDDNKQTNLKNLGYTDEQVAAMIAAGDAAQFAE